MNTKQIEQKLNAAMEKFREKNTPLCRNRVIELVNQLKPIFKITHLTMGMGGYVFRGKEFDVVYDDDSKGKIDMSDLFECLNPRTTITVIALTQKYRKVLEELEELLDFISDVSVPVDIFDIDFTK